MQSLQEIGKETLDQQLVHHRQPPIFDLELFRYQTILNTHDAVDPQAIFKIYAKTFDRWIHDTKLNKVSGLEKFEHRDFCVGVTGFIDDLYVRYGSRIAYLHREYSYHWRLNIGKYLTDYRYLEEGDQLIISAPFSYYCDNHPKMNEILDYCDENKISVHVDSAWYGCVRDFEINYNRDCIKSVGFSLSKGLSCGHNRIGIRYTKKRELGPITITNDFNMAVCHLMWLGIQLMENYSCDYLHEKYGDIYAEICRYLELTPTKAIHVARRLNTEDNELHPVGVGTILKNMYFEDK